MNFLYDVSEIKPVHGSAREAYYIDGLVQDWSNSTANALELLGSVLLMRSDAVVSLLTNGSAAFIRKLHCQWLIGLRQRQITVVIQGPAVLH